MRTPKFWYIDDTFAAWLLSFILVPFSLLYQAISKEFSKVENPYKSKAAPVICIGNIVAGGAGKTPTTIALAKYLKDKGYNPHIISRGYGGTNDTELKVNPKEHDARLVGDEPFMMAQMGLDVWVSSNRSKLAYLANKAGADVILMDDGLQNNKIVKDFSFVVIDGLMGFGNGRLIPAGPLREPIESGLKKANACIFIDDDITGVSNTLNDLDLVTAEFKPLTTEFEGKDVYPFAGMGRPEKFLRSLFKMGANIVAFDDFPDHYYYKDIDIATLLDKAKKRNAIPVTTRKDFTRISKQYQGFVKVLDVELELDKETLDEVLKPVFKMIEGGKAKRQATQSKADTKKPAKKG